MSPAHEKIHVASKISKLTEEIASFQSDGHVIINGDLNAWTGNANDTVQPDKYDNNFHIVSNYAPPRNSRHKAIDRRGKELLDMCKSLDLLIVNGRKLGDPFGEFTSFQPNGNSVVDYLIASESLFSEISTLNVGEYVPWLSDHCPLFYDLEINEGFDKVNTTPPPLNPAPKQYLWSDQGTEKFLYELKTAQNIQKLESVFSMDFTDPGNAVNSLTEVLIDVADKAKIKTILKSKNTGNPPWFDDECVHLKKQITILGKQMKKSPNCQATRSELSQAKKMLKKAVQRKKIEFKNTLIEKMNFRRRDAKMFWKLLDKLDQKHGENVIKDGLSSNKWIEHFKSVLHNPCVLKPLPKNTKVEGPIDFPISNEEIKLGAYVLRPGKSPGYDSISNEMISCLLNIKPELIRKLFNAILQNPIIINTWHTSMIIPIHKKGSKTDPDNYRGISLLSSLAKYFLAILNQRLLKFVIENKILSNSQLGFLPGNRTSDALLILHNLIDYYCHKNKKYIFGCFVDFSKAFDSIPRYKLFEKLLRYNISGKFYDCLANLYTKDQACVKLSFNVSETFTVNQGVKQGCILSPLLFNIFISDLQDKLDLENNEPVEIAPNILCSCMIWADDLLMLSRSEEGLQTMLDNLHTFSESNGLSANIDKTKVMIFNKSGRHIHRSFHWGALKVETTREYKYLGFLVTPSGEINSGLKDLKDRALKAFMKLKTKLGPFFRKYPTITIKLFDTLIKPILLYASDFWGLLKLPQNNPFETLFHSFCKQLLGVQKQTTNVGVLLELGLVPLKLYARKHAFKNWYRIARLKKANTLVVSSYENAIAQNLSWPKNIEGNLSQIGMLDVFLSNGEDNNCHAHFFQRLWDIFHQEAFTEINKPNSKLRTYKNFKLKIGIENYLSLITCTKRRMTMSKFRLSNHNLMIEIGRHKKISKELRFCPLCPNEIEDEMHFVMSCKGFDKQRKDFFTKIDEENSHFRNLNNFEKFKFLFIDNDTINATAHYIQQNLLLREILITPQ